MLQRLVFELAFSVKTGKDDPAILNAEAKIVG
jgi:hypothetical protein